MAIMSLSDALSTRPLALVTGASSGIGYELARQFAAGGFDLVLVAEDDPIHTVAQEFSPQGVSAHAIQADLATLDGVDEVVRSLDALDRPVTAAALNAGVGVGGRFDQTDLEADLRLVRLNVESVVHLAKILVRDMVARGEGKLLLTSSIAATMPGPFYATYAASKSFLQSFAEAIRNELADTGVTVTSLMPGPTDTNFFERADLEDTRAGAGPKADPADVAREGFEALMAGDDHVVAGGLKNKVQAATTGLMPDPVKAKMHRILTEPGSGDS
jgi:uncharacterized protein